MKASIVSMLFWAAMSIGFVWLVILAVMKNTEPNSEPETKESSDGDANCTLP